jgi:hypothetical protein
VNIEILPIILQGVLSALIATSLIFIAAKYWNTVIVPWYEDRVYKDIRIDNEWKTSGEEKGDTFSEMAKVKQRAHRVWGEIIYKTDADIVEYEFEGEFKNLILTARYWVKGQNNLDRGTFTLMLKNNGKIMSGFYAWYADVENDVLSGKYEWIKC